MAELADAPDLGSGVPDVQVQVLLSALHQKSSNYRESLVFAAFFTSFLIKQSRIYCAIMNIAMSKRNVRCTSFLK